MIIEYENVFTDVSHHRVISARGCRKFKLDYKALRKLFNEDIDIIKKKLLYGSDWHVLKRLKNYGAFKNRYIEVLKHEDFFTDGEIQDFLGGNALNFLGLLPGGKNRERLEKFYRSKEIDPPKWFKSTSRLNTT